MFAARTRLAGSVLVVERRALAGPRSPLVAIVPGYGVSLRQSRPAASELARHARVVVLELPGFGRPGASRGLPVAELSGALEGWLDEAGESSATFVASSFGCQPVLELASRRPDRVDALVLVGPTVDRRARSALRQAARLALTAPAEPPWLLAAIARDYARTGLRAGLRSLREALAHEPELTLPRVQAPTLVVRGSRDRVVPQRWAEEVAALLPHGRLLVVRGAAHAVVASHPRELAAATLPLLAR